VPADLFDLSQQKTPPNINGVVFANVPVTNGFNVTYANANSTSTLNVYVNGTYKTSFSVYNTGSWNTYRTD
jgi:hypothetical protein